MDRKPDTNVANQAQIETSNRRFEEWKSRESSTSFKNFYAMLVKDQLARGKPHATLGGKLKKGEFGQSGQSMFQRLVNLGLREDHVLVDYGCGTLRVGVHAIKYLGQGAYWGLDIAEFLLEEGRALIGKDLIGQKRPNLRVISPESVEEAAVARADFLLSSAVIIHVHPDELAEYVSNVMRIIGHNGQAILTAKCAREETLQYAGRSWAHSYPLLDRAFADSGGRASVLEKEVLETDSSGGEISRYLLRVTSESRS